MRGLYALAGAGLPGRWGGNAYRVGSAARSVAGGMEERVRVAVPLRRALNRAFPDTWSFLLGEIVLYSFVILLLTGTYLTFFYDPSMTETLYMGRYVPLHDVSMSQAYASTLQISFDVRGGLLIRQIHHWAALLFMAAVLLHLCRTFFNGAFRKPRELTWVIGVVILIVLLLEGFSGYTLPDDVISGASLHIAESIMLSLPVIGTWVAFAVFGGPYPGHVIIPRLYVIHVLLVPALLMALIGAHLVLVLRQQHTAPPRATAPAHPRAAPAGPDPPRSSRHAGDRRGSYVPGVRAFPAYALRTGGLFFMIAGVLAGLGGVAQINPIWLYGPYHPAVVSSNSQPDWYTFFLEGALRLFPPWEIRAAGHSVPPVFWPGAVLPTVMFVLTAGYPWLERLVTRDRTAHHVSQLARDAPVRSGIGAAGLSFYLLLTLAAADDFASKAFDIPIENIVWAGRIGVIIVPVATFVITHRTCRWLAVRERQRIRTGTSAGVITKLPSGEWAELTYTDTAPTDTAPADTAQDDIAQDSASSSPR